MWSNLAEWYSEKRLDLKTEKWIWIPLLLLTRWWNVLLLLRWFSPLFPLYRIIVSFKASPSYLWESSGLGRLHTCAQGQVWPCSLALLSCRGSWCGSAAAPPPPSSQYGFSRLTVIQGGRDSKYTGFVALEHGFGDELGVMKMALTLILFHFTKCPEEAQFVPRISHILYQTLSCSFWP